MNNLSSFLEKFQRLLGSQFLVRDIVAKSIFDTLSVVVEPQRIIIKGGVVYVETSPLIRGEIMMRKREILGKIKESAVGIVDIR